jgi:V8-like Glu-specific endopeptidase
MPVTFTHLFGSRKGEADTFDAEQIKVGRAPDNDLRFGDLERRVSSHHAEITCKGGGFLLRDLGSTNGTMVNGRRVVTGEIKHDDMIEFGAGGPLVRFQIEQDGAARASSRRDALKGARGASDEAHPLGESTVELIVDRAVRNRTGNFKLVAAIVAAMTVGAIAGVLLSRPGAPSSVAGGFATAAEQNRPAVVFIRVKYEALDSAGQTRTADPISGTGFIISRSGLIVTNRHLVRRWEYAHDSTGLTGRVTSIEVVLPGRRLEEALPAALVRHGQASEPDVAILKIEPPFELPVVHGIETNFTAINQGDDVAVIGYPLGTRLTGADRIESSLSAGVISRINQNVIQLDLLAFQGNSGGPVLNRRGDVIGILTSNISGAQGIALCTPIAVALDMAEGL